MTTDTFREPVTTEAIAPRTWRAELLRFALMDPETNARFWRLVSRGEATECWPWRGTTSNGYGRFTVWHEGHRIIASAHRLAWMFAQSTEFPPGLEACHTCDNGICCNPHHIYAGTHADNMRDAVHSGVKPDVILDWEKAQAIRLRRGTTSARTVGAEYGVDAATIQDIWAGRTWRAPRTSFCFWCRQAVVFDDMEARRVITDTGDEWVCGRCWERADAPVPLDYMSHEGDEE